MEVPSLACSTILSLNDKVSAKIVNVSTSSKSGNNMEVHVNNESIVSVPLSLSWFSLPVFGVDELPLLVSLSIELVHEDVSVFGINCT
jgi:hypothetical protein